MSSQFLGKTIDIHGGGADLLYPHHESEIAQCDATHGKGFANYWLHNNMVTVNGMKMGKSLGNAISLKELFSGSHKLLEKAYAPFTVRFFVLSSHYRSPIDFSNEALQAAEKGLARLHATVKLVRDQLSSAPDGDLPAEIAQKLDEHKQTFIDAMNDDFNTPQGIAALFDLNKTVNTLLNSGQTLTKQTLAAIDNLYRTLGEDVLGIIPANLTAEAGGDLVDQLLNLLITLRQEARARKDWTTGDAIRNQLAEMGVTLEDRPDGTIWKSGA
jgi:cysteinyl-tRNA synthetase